MESGLEVCSGSATWGMTGPQPFGTVFLLDYQLADRLGTEIQLQESAVAGDDLIRQSIAGS